MADDGRNPLELDAVVRRFAESAEALASVREQLRVLTELRETEERANASLEETAGQVARFTTEAASILKGLEDAQTKVAEVLKSGADLLDGTELKGVGETVRANAESISGVAGRVDALESKVAELIAVVGTLQTSIGQGIHGLKEDIQSVQADVKSPIIVKRLWGKSGRIVDVG